jgi:hypothetical protein
MRTSFGVLLVVLSLSAARCAPVGTGGTIGSTGGGAQGGGVSPNPPSRVGILEVSGTQVFVNGANAHSGEAIYDGNRVTTGASSSGRINLDGGGSLQLDENTDPVFRFQLLKEGWCLVVNIVSGQMFDDTHTGGCVEISTPDGLRRRRQQRECSCRQLRLNLDGSRGSSSTHTPIRNCGAPIRERHGQQREDGQYSSSVIR